ncbi:serine protease [Chaetomidium leptoderma]|uniref:Serine protease n=1 Tax=Chaetomidium leptoderma TaxID=669021 RepID=A0AAN6VRM2_9PEZI|nr:serine protease [Chaetomidium leptoderma]
MKLTIILCGLAAAAAFPLAPAAAPIKNHGVSDDIVIPDTYIVKYKAHVDAIKIKDHEDDFDDRARKANKKGIFDRFNVLGLQGYIAEIPRSELSNLTESDLVKPIEYVEKDTIVKSTAVSAVIPDIPDLTKRAMTRQRHAPWGLARISHRSRDSTEYYYSDTAGEGIRVYVLDTGVRLSHSDLGGRAVWGANFVASSTDGDEDGHGTHVAGILGGTTYGVAKKATLVSVKVLDRTGTGSMSGLLQGLNWAVADAKNRGLARKAVINMSLSGSYMQSVNDGIQAATDAGLTVVVAAGNKDQDVMHWSPASAPSAITVGAIDQNDQRAEFSNWGAGIDIFAPGVAISSAYNTSDSAVVAMSGTSMASPHVAGLAAYFIANEGLSGGAVASRILDVATKGVGDSKGGSDRIAPVNPPLKTSNLPSPLVAAAPTLTPSLPTNLATQPPPPLPDVLLSSTLLLVRVHLVGREGMEVGAAQLGPPAGPPAAVDGYCTVKRGWARSGERSVIWRLAVGM